MRLRHGFRPFLDTFQTRWGPISDPIQTRWGYFRDLIQTRWGRVLFILLEFGTAPRILEDVVHSFVCELESWRLLFSKAKQKVTFQSETLAIETRQLSQHRNV